MSLAAITVGVLIHLARKERLRARIATLEERLEDMADRQWEHREAEERARTLLEVQGDLVVRRDGEGRITYANEAFAQTAGRATDVLRGERFGLEIVEQGDVTIATDGTRLHDQTIATPHGLRVIAWRDVAVHAHDAIETQSVGRDVTERAASGRAMAQARDDANAANRAKGQFLATVSHEIRTPLNGILGMTDLLLDTPLTAEQTSYARAIKASGDALLTLIGGVLDLSKAEAGRLDLLARPFALAPMVEEAVELLSPRAHAKGLDIGCYIDATLPDFVAGDAAGLRQVLLNLAGNAVKFTERGGIVVAVTGGVADDVTIAITDTGIGIAPDVQPRIFEAFEQADPLTGGAAGGTGLGLAISETIVARMGGDITVDSAPGRGATFKVTLPLPAADRAPDKFSQSFPDAPALHAAQVLLVGPTAGHAPLLARTLGMWDAKTCVACDDAVAHALIPERAWDAVVVDRAIGEAAAHALGAAGRGIARRIVLVAPSQRHELPAFKAAGFTGYLIKPVRRASLQAMFDEAAPDIVTEAGPAPMPAENPQQAVRGLSILVAEDNEINALLARALLTKMGHRPALAPDGTAAVAAWRDARTAGQPFDFVLMDLQMPGMDGLSATREIRVIEIETGVRPTPIFAVTANVAEEDRDRCLAAGMDGFLEKPLKRERLEEALATMNLGATRAA